MELMKQREELGAYWNFSKNERALNQLFGDDERRFCLLGDNKSFPIELDVNDLLEFIVLNVTVLVRIDYRHHHVDDVIFNICIRCLEIFTTDLSVTIDVKNLKCGA
ncbi:hypothetical protein L6452_09358 [Arctium lappa]|uniref:Uncharacterized protein n=1 Tax=Arctium lappa TaxID=4217 RepID=A0ACB9DKD4_ARCLA|nr:hypothetical protein L6452_09358 [Arctium lappa]